MSSTRDGGNILNGGAEAAAAAASINIIICSHCRPFFVCLGPRLGEGDHRPPIELRSDDRLRSIHVSLPPNAVAIKSERSREEEEAETKHVAEIRVGDVVIVVDAAFVLTALFMANLLIFSSLSHAHTELPRPRESIAASCI